MWAKLLTFIAGAVIATVVTLWAAGEFALVLTLSLLLGPEVLKVVSCYSSTSKALYFYSNTSRSLDFQDMLKLLIVGVENGRSEND